MWYMGKRRDLRVDPQAFFPLAARAFMVVKAYGPWESELPPAEESATVSRHAVGEDYHVSVRRMLQPLKRAIGAAGYRFRAFTDAAPVMEKVLAVRAGLGVMGRNTLLTHPRFGSWVFIGGIVTDAPLVCDAPLPDPGHCQSCRRCIDGCPGQALREEGSLDARKCISYWTTEADVAELPASVAAVLGGRAFGCDRCQEVCPMNDGLPAPLVPVSPGRTFPIGELLAMDEEAFLQLFGGTTIRRLGFARFRRNVRAIANLSETHGR
jgi:epoxyqueuosine reductase